MPITQHIHRVVSIKAEARMIGGGTPGSAPFVSTDFTFTYENGDYITVSAFSKDYLQIDGAEHVNHVAAPMGDPDEYREEEST